MGEASKAVGTFRKLIKSKIQGLRITGKELYYEGSLELDADLLTAADILPGEMVQVVNVNNGERFETYVIPGSPRSGSCILKGAAARLGEVGDAVIVMSFAYLEIDRAAGIGYEMIRVQVDERNRIVSTGGSQKK